MLDVADLPPFSTLPVEAVVGLLRHGDTFASPDRQIGGLIDGCAPAAGAELNFYEDFLSLLARRLIRATEEAPQKDTGELTSALNLYIREWMFGESFNPLAGDGWRLLLLPPLTTHIVRVFSSALTAATRDKSGQTGRAQRSR